MVLDFFFFLSMSTLQVVVFRFDIWFGWYGVIDTCLKDVCEYILVALTDFFLLDDAKNNQPIPLPPYGSPSYHSSHTPLLYVLNNARLVMVLI